MKSATSFTPPSTGLIDTQFSTIKSARLSDSEGPEKYYLMQDKFIDLNKINKYSNGML
jgi:hypothetical protein